MITYDVTIKGLEEQLVKLRQFEPIAAKHLKRGMTRTVVKVQACVKPLTPVFTGRLRQSIVHEVRDEGRLSIVGQVGSSLDEIYPAVMELGRTSKKMPPPAALERWVWIRWHPKDIKGAAFVLARAIAKRGIKPHKFMKDGLAKAKSSIEGFFRQALDDIAKDLSNGNR